jgi:serine/threonine-protein kinase
LYYEITDKKRYQQKGTPHMLLMMGLPPELTPYTHDLAAFERATGITLHFPPVGTGGGGTVFKATSPEGATLAIKVVAADDAARREQVCREAAILRQVQHAGALGGAGLLWEQHYPQVALCFLAMDYIAGETLADLIAAEGPLTEPLALHLTLALAEALSALHQQQIIHRDVKPENVLLLKVGVRYQPIVVDYGIAKVGHRTARGAKAATDGYAPPEQYQGGTDRRTDGYALGATLYAMVTGQTPPTSTSRDPAEPLAPRHLNPAISPELELVIQIATSYYPQQRFPTMGVLLDALRLVETGDRVALVGMLQALGLLTSVGQGWRQASAASLPPLPPKPPALPPVAQAGAGHKGKSLRCPYCQHRYLVGETFCDECGAALQPGQPVYPPAAQPAATASGAAAPPAAALLQRTPAPQLVSLLLAGQIVLGGPPLSRWEKRLLVLAYAVFLGGVALGGRSLSLAAGLPTGVALGCSLVLLLLIPLFARLLTRWEQMTITRRGQARPLRRGVVLLVSLLGLLGMFCWLLREVLLWQGAWFLNPPAFSLVLYVGLAYFASTLIEALLA